MEKKVAAYVTKEVVKHQIKETKSNLKARPKEKIRKSLNKSFTLEARKYFNSLNREQEQQQDIYIVRIADYIGEENSKMIKPLLKSPLFDSKCSDSLSRLEDMLFEDPLFKKETYTESEESSEAYHTYCKNICILCIIMLVVVLVTDVLMYILGLKKKNKSRFQNPVALIALILIIGLTVYMFNMIRMNGEGFKIEPGLIGGYFVIQEVAEQVNLRTNGESEEEKVMAVGDAYLGFNGAGDDGK